MSSNKLLLELIVSEKGMKIVNKDIESLGSALDSTSRSKREAGKAADALDYKLKHGVQGTSSAAKSFSKLNQAIGHGSSGLVGAYATLAANTFAVSAAFLALREAASVSQVLRGLEFQGAKTGQTFSLAAKQVQELTGFALNSADALRATATITSAGFGTEEIEKLTTAARNASLALGRNLPDAMERITKGVVKLEPELLDELGIMTKLTEATANYARETNKSVNALSNFEKRQAFLNAVVAEAEVKFAGIGEAIGSNPYDKLLANFKDLSLTVMSGVDVVGRFAAAIVSLNEFVMVGAIGLFANSLKNQLLPWLSEAPKRAIEAAKRLREQADAQRDVVTATLDQAKADRDSYISRSRTMEIPSQSPAKFREAWMSIQDGGDIIKETDKAILSLNRSIDMHQKQMDNGFFGRNGEAVKQETINNLTRAREEVIKLRNAEIAAQQNITAMSAEASRAIVNQTISRRLATAMEQKASAIALLTQGEIRQSWAALTLAVKNYSSAVLKARALESGSGSGGLGAGMNRMFDAIKIGGFAAGTGLRMIGSGLLSLLPTISMVTVAFGMLKQAYEFMFTTNADKERTKALEEFTTVVDHTSQKLKELERLNNTVGESASITSARLKLQGNMVTELGEAARKMAQDFREAKKAQEESSSLWGAISGNLSDVAAYNTGLSKDSLFLQQYNKDLAETNEKIGLWTGGSGKLSQALTGLISLTWGFDKQTVALSKSVDALTKGMDQRYVKVLAASLGGMEKISASPALQEQFIAKASKAYEGLSTRVDDLTESFKQAETAATDFINSSVTTTKYDNVLRAFGSINTAIGNLSSNAMVTNGDMVSMISGMGANTTKFLESNAQLDLERIRRQQALVKSLEEQSKQEGALGYIAGRKLDQARQYLEELGAQRFELVRALEAGEARLRQLQQEERLGKLTISQLQTQLSVYAEIYKGTEAGAALRIKREKEIRDLQAQQIKNQIELNKSLIATAEASLKQLELQVLLNQEYLETYSHAVNQQLVELQVLRSQKEKEGLSVLTTEAYNDQLAVIDKQIAAMQTAKEEVERQLKAHGDIAAKNKEIRDHKDAIKALEIEYANIVSGNLTDEQTRVAIQKEGLAISRSQWELYRRNEASLENIKDMETDISALLKGNMTERTRSIQSVLRETQKGLEDLHTQSRSQIAEMQNAVDEARAVANRAAAEGKKEEQAAANELLKSRQDILDRTKLSVDIRERELQIAQSLKLVEMSVIKSREEGIELQQKAITLYDKMYEQRSKALDNRAELATLRAETSAISRGTSVSDKAQKALDYKAAKEQADLAKEQLGFRKMGVELEYDLLEAQRVALAEELKARKEIIKQQAIANNIPASAIQDSVSILDSAIQNISNKSYESVKQMALKNEEDNVTILQARAEKARQEWLNVGRTANPVEKALQAIEESKMSLATALGGGVEMKVATPLSPVVKANENLTEAMSNLVSPLNGILEELRKRNQKPEDLTPIIDSSGITKAIKTSNLEARQDAAKTAAKWVESQQVGGGIKLKAEELIGHGAGRKGTHAKGSQHYLGTAFDLNAVGPNGERYTEATNKVLGPIFDKLADQFRKMGAEVIWRSNRHFDHMHVAFKTAIAKSEAEINAMVQEEVKKASTPAPTTVSPPSGPKYDPGKSILDQLSNTESIAPISNMMEQIQLQSVPLKATLEEMWTSVSLAMAPYIEQLTQLGPGGEVAAAVFSGIDILGQQFTKLSEGIKTGSLGFSDYATAASAAVGVISSITAASSNARIAAIDKEIAAEQRRDGKSADSIARIESMEKRKDQIAKKQFNMQKKLSMAQAVISTAAAIAGMLASPPVGPWNIGLAAAVGAMGAAQLAIIAGTSYESSYSPNNSAAAMPSELSIGKRGDSVNLANGPNANAGGEIGYLRGESGYGANSSDFRTIGSAYGGRLGRGWGNRGFIVGEKGPEEIIPEVPVSVRPNDELGNANNLTATFHVNAIDSRGVKEMLVDQRGNIIQMLREAANATGERFLESVDTNIYTRPSVDRL